MAPQGTHMTPSMGMGKPPRSGKTILPGPEGWGHHRCFPSNAGQIWNRSKPCLCGYLCAREARKEVTRESVKKFQTPCGSWIKRTYTQGVCAAMWLFSIHPPPDTAADVHDPKGSKDITKSGCPLQTSGGAHVRYSGGTRRLQKGIFAAPPLPLIWM